jgi:hypothetical protein
MEQARIWIRCTAWGGVSLGIGTLTYALCSPANAGCSTNLIVLTHGTVTARGCAAFSVMARFGVGLMVLGAVLLLGSFLVTLRARRQATAVVTTSEPAPEQPVVLEAPAVAEALTDVVSELSAAGEGVPPSRRKAEREGPIPPGSYEPASDGATSEEPMTLPPGWYGNPNNPDRPVQWWDGTRLTERPLRPGR